MPARPHLLFIAFYFPPSRSSGVFRSVAMANRLVRDGFDVTVLAPQPEYFTDYIKTADETLVGELDRRIRVVTARFPARKFEPDIRRYSWLRGTLPTVADTLAKQWETRILPEFYSPWIPHLVTAAVAVHRRRSVDFVFATGNPFAALAAAGIIGRLLRVPYGLDYRDAWTLNQWDDGPLVANDSLVARWERWLMDKAALVTFVNDPQTTWHQQRYPGTAAAMLTVANGVDHDLAASLHEIPHEPDRTALRFGFLGTITNVMPLGEFTKAWSLARERCDLVAAATMSFHGHLGYFGQSAAIVRRLLPDDGSDGIAYLGPVAKSEVASVYRELDVLVLLSASSSYVTSGKVFEYMATAKPIIVVNEPGTHVRVPLEGYPLVVSVASLQPDDIADALVEVARMATSVTETDRARAWEHAARYERQYLLDPLVRRLEELADAG